MKLTVVIPAYNAARHIEAVLERVAGLVSSGLQHVLVVDDGSRDDTAQRVERYRPLGFRLSLLKRTQNGGYGAETAAPVAKAIYEQYYGVSGDSPDDLEAAATDAATLETAETAVPAG